MTTGSNARLVAGAPGAVMRRNTLPDLLVLGVLLALGISPKYAVGQVRASERASVAQTVDGTVITLDYSRPRARGRADLFGEVVKWGEVWTPGANDATRLTLSHDVKLGGRPIPAGSWSVWLVVSRDGPWELVLDPRDSLFHTAHPEPTEEQIRLPVDPDTGEPVEVLTWSFPEIGSTGGVVELAWGDARVAIPFEVEPSLPLTVAREHALPYVGEWSLSFGGGGDAGPGFTEPPPPLDFDVRYEEDGTLRVATWFPDPDEGMVSSELLLMRRAEGVFLPGIMEDGELWETLAETYLEFEVEGGRATAFVLRGPDDQVFARGERREP